MTSRDAFPKLWRSHQARRFPSSLAFVSISGSRLQSLHQTPIGDLDRSLIATPCPRNTSVPSLVQSNSSWLFVQLAPGSRRGQSSQEKRPSALRKCSVGWWVSNQRDWLPDYHPRDIECFAFSRDHRSSDLFEVSSRWLHPWLRVEPAPVRRLVHPPPLL
jgi:hypothetical protein